MRIIIATAAIICLVAANASGQEVIVKGTVVDTDDKPIADVEVANFWIGKHDFLGFGKGITMTPYEGAKSDSAGKFSVKVPAWMPEPAVLVIAADRKSGAVAEFKKDTTELPPLKLAPLVKVTGKFESKELGHRPPWTNVYITTLKNARLVQSDSMRADFACYLPPGKYKFNGYGSDVKGINREIDVPADKPELDLGTIDLPATEIAKHVGKEPPPLKITDSRGLNKEMKLSDLKGKWVLIEFWGFW